MRAYVIMVSNRGAIWWQPSKAQEVVIGTRAKASKILHQYQDKASCNHYWIESVKLTKD